MLPIFIVSLKQDVEKRAVISKILNDFNIDFTFIDAVYGKKLPDDYFNSVIVKSSGSILSRGFLPTPGEVGCTLSHLKLYKEILDRNLQWACVLEDDAILDDRFNEFIRSFSETNLDKRSIYILGGQNGLSSSKYIIKSYKNCKVIGNQKFYKTIKSEAYIYRTCCYFISNELANQLLSLSKTRFIIADDWNYLVKNNFINSIYLSNFVNHPVDRSNSNIHHETANVSNNVKKTGITFHRKLRSFVSQKARLLILSSYKILEKKD